MNLAPETFQFYRQERVLPSYIENLSTSRDRLMEAAENFLHSSSKSWGKEQFEVSTQFRLAANSIWYFGSGNFLPKMRSIISIRKYEDEMIVNGLNAIINKSVLKLDKDLDTDRLPDLLIDHGLNGTHLKFQQQWYQSQLTGFRDKLFTDIKEFSSQCSARV